MLESAFEFIKGQLQTNQFFGGGLILGVGGMLLAYLRNVPSRIWANIRRQFVLELDILDREDAFMWLDRWLSSHNYTQTRARNLSVRTLHVSYEERQANPLLDPRPRVIFTPAPGAHYFFFKGRLVILTRERPDPTQAREGGHGVNTLRESFHLQIFTRNREIASDLLHEAREVALPSAESRVGIHKPAFGGWDEQFKRTPRDLNSVILRGSLLEDLLKDVQTFFARRSWYQERGIPYRRGYLLYGPPGTGKSSTVLALASALKMDIAILSLSGASLDDGELISLLSSLPVNAIVLIEDIDCVFRAREATTEGKASRLTFSGLLNALDGVAASEGRVLFATTNRIEVLDPALIRAGRVDRKEYVGYASQDQIVKMYSRFFPEVSEDVAHKFAASFEPDTISMAAIQAHLIKYAHVPEDAVLYADEAKEEHVKLLEAEKRRVQRALGDQTAQNDPDEESGDVID